MKPGKALSCIFSLASLKVDPTQNLPKYKRRLARSAHRTV